MLSLVVGLVVRLHIAMRAAMLVLSTADLAGVLGMERRGLSIYGDVIGDSTINCVGADCASGVTSLGSNVRSCTVSWKFTLGACGWGVTGGKSVRWSCAMASIFCWPFRLVVPLRVAMRS